MNCLSIHQRMETMLRQPVSKETLTQYQIVNDLLVAPQISDWFRNQLQMWSEQLTLEMESAPNNHSFYILETHRILEEYRRELQIPIKINFSSTFGTEHYTERKVDICERAYIRCLYQLYCTGMIGNFVQQQSLPPKPEPEEGSQGACEDCGSQDFAYCESDIIVACTLCGLQKDISASKVWINYTQKYSYDNNKRSHFLNCINHFQGLQKYDIPKELLDKLEQKMDEYKLIDHSKPTRVEQFRLIDKQHIKLFLEELGLSKLHYDNINLIYHTITDKPLSNVSQLTNKLLKDFDIFNDCYNRKYPNIERKNFNYQLLLYQLLCKHNYKCNRKDFNFLKTTERKSFHEDIYQSIFNELDWNYTSIF